MDHNETVRSKNLLNFQFSNRNKGKILKYQNQNSVKVK